jgi:hypothetical protein
MLSYLHESLVALLRKSSASAAELLRTLDVQLPVHDDVRAESSDVNDLKPTEYRADLVFVLMRGSKKVLGVIVEVQLRRDRHKSYAWPAYIANLRARHHCPVCLLVVTTEDAVARWAQDPIHLGPGTLCQPWVIGPSNMPVITDLQRAEENIELAVLSAIEHRQNPDVMLTARIASAAITACAGIDDERFKLYFDLIRKSLFGAPEALEATMNSFGIEYQSDFARRYVAEGKAEGLKEGRIELILKQLTVRFGPLPDRIQTRVRGAQDAELDTVAERLLTARTLEQALGTLY